MQVYKSEVEFVDSKIVSNTAWGAGAISLQKGSKMSLTRTLLKANGLNVPSTLPDGVNPSISSPCIRMTTGSSLDIVDSKFVDNYANLPYPYGKIGVNGGAIEGLSGNHIVADNTVFINNSVQAVPELPVVGGAAGGAIFLNAQWGPLSYPSSLIARNCRFANNKAGIGGVVQLNENCSALFIDSRITGNTARISGGAVAVSDFSNVTVVNTVVSKNSAALYGGAFELLGPKAVFNSYASKISNNYVYAVDDKFNVTTGVGGAISMKNRSTCHLVSTTLANNSAPIKGGAVYVESNGTLQVEDSTISKSYAGGSGGGIFGQKDASISVVNSKFALNTAVDQGGALWLEATTPQYVDTVTFKSNSAARGGGIWQNATGFDNLLQVTSSMFKSNTATSGGADIGSLSSFQCTSTVAKNTLPANACKV